MRFGDCTYLEIRDYIGRGAVAVVPTGCTEQQGPHLSVDFDTWLAESVTLAASERAKREFGVLSLVVPALPFGPTPEHRSFGSGFIDVLARQQEEIVWSVLISLLEQGFSKIVVWRGCGQHDLSATVARFNAECQGCVAFLPEIPYHDIWCRIADPDVPGGHADSFATSLALYLRPGSVREDLMPAPQVAEVNWTDPHLDFQQYSETGVIGDPTRASAALGEKLWDAVVADAAATLRAVSDGTR